MNEHQVIDNISQELKSNEICPFGFWTCLGPTTSFFFQGLPWATGMSILCLSYHYILEADDLLSGFTGPQIGILLQKEQYSVSFIPYLDDL